MDSQLTATSKFLSYILRHRPDAIDLELNSGGWASVSDLVQHAAEHGHVLSEEMIKEVVVSNDKRRFKLSEDGLYIRASQGHSFRVDLDLLPIQPPSVLFHGTATRFLASIMAKGLLPSGRQHVHLSMSYETAIAVGQRHGRPTVLQVQCQQMYQDGFSFYRSDNGVWLTEHIPASYLIVINPA